jgi:hypothetical protein
MNRFIAGYWRPMYRIIRDIERLLGPGRLL